jgi:hypothetical protein
MKKYAVDLLSTDKIIDKRTERVVVIDWIEPSLYKDAVTVNGYFEDDGSDWTRVLDHDSTVRMA